MGLPGFGPVRVRSRVEGLSCNRLVASVRFRPSSILAAALKVRMDCSAGVSCYDWGRPSDRLGVRKALADIRKKPLRGVFE